MKNILFIYDFNRPFIQRDIEILEQHFCVNKQKWSWSKNLRGCLFLCRMVRAIRNADVVVVWFTLLDSVFVTLFARLFGTRTMFFIGGHEVEEIREYGYGSMLRPVYRYLLPISFRFANLVVVPSNCSLEHFRRYSPGDNAMVVAHGFDPTEILVSVKKKQVVTVAPVVKERLFLKGVIPFVRIANELPEYQFIIIGEIQEDARRIVECEAIHRNLVLSGPLPFAEVKNIFAESSIYCQLSYHESFGCALAEAMLAGCIPIAANRGAMPEVLGGVGYLVEFDDVLNAVDIIKVQMEQPSREPEFYRNNIISRFNVSRRGESLVSLIYSIGNK